MKQCRRLAAGLMLSIVVAVPSLQAAPAAGKVGVFDAQRIFQQMNGPRKAEAAMKAAAAPVEKEFQRQQAELQKSAEAYRAAQAGMNPQTRALKEKDLNLKAQALQKYQQEKGAELNAKRKELLVPVQQKLDTAIQTVARNEGYSLVLDKQAMIYGTPESDLTFKVMNQLNIK